MTPDKAFIVGMLVGVLLMFLPTYSAVLWAQEVHILWLAACANRTEEEECDTTSS